MLQASPASSSSTPAQASALWGDRRPTWQSQHLKKKKKSSSFNKRNRVPFSVLSRLKQPPLSVPPGPVFHSQQRGEIPQGIKGPGETSRPPRESSLSAAGRRKGREVREAARGWPWSPLSQGAATGPPWRRVEGRAGGGGGSGFINKPAWATRCLEEWGGVCRPRCPAAAGACGLGPASPPPASGGARPAAPHRKRLLPPLHCLPPAARAAQTCAGFAQAFHLALFPLAGQGEAGPEERSHYWRESRLKRLELHRAFCVLFVVVFMFVCLFVSLPPKGIFSMLCRG